MENYIINTNEKYNYNSLKTDIKSLKKLYPFLEIGIIGYSVLGSPIPFVRIGSGINKVCYSGAIHANEWITTPLLMKFIEDFSYSYINNKKLNGYDVNYIFHTTSIYIVPMVNPDGVNLVTGNVSANTYNYAKQIANNYPTLPFPNGWKANINGIDLNLQFPARMERCKRNKIFSRFCISCAS